VEAPCAVAAVGDQCERDPGETRRRHHDRRDSRINHFGENVVSTMTEAALSKLDLVLEHETHSFLCGATQVLYQSDEDLAGPQLHLPGK
jgi:hypothetical protein